MKTFDTFDFTAVPQLPKPKVLSRAEGGFVKARENVICLGPSGTGKTHTIIALGLGAIQAGYRVRFVAAIQLAQELLAAQQEYRLPRYLKTWQKVDLAIVDEPELLRPAAGGERQEALREAKGRESHIPLLLPVI